MTVMVEGVVDRIELSGNQLDTLSMTVRITIKWNQ